MSKKNKRNKVINAQNITEIEQLPSSPIQEIDSDIAVKEVDVAEVAKKDIFSFPSKSACPRCGATDTIATSTQTNIQYRKCQRPICRYTYKVIGDKV